MGTQNQSIEYKTRVCGMFTVLASLFVSMLQHCGVPVHLYCIDDGAPGHQDIPGPYWGVCVTVATSALQSKQRLGRSALAPAALCFAHLLIWKYRKKSGLTGTPARKLFPTSPRHCALVISASHYAPDCGQCWCSLHGVTANDHEWANWWDLLKDVESVYILDVFSTTMWGSLVDIQGANLQSNSVLGRKFAKVHELITWGVRFRERARGQVQSLAPKRLEHQIGYGLKPIITTFGGINIQ
jgi:hypothetical protein